jgi:hypothetical protein
MYLLITVVNDEHLLKDLVTGWLDIGVTGGTVVESTGLLRLISDTIPIFAGFRSLVSGGGSYNRTLLTAIADKETLDQAVAFLKSLCAGRKAQGIYMVAPLLDFGSLSAE